MFRNSSEFPNRSPLPTDFGLEQESCLSQSPEVRELEEIFLELSKTTRDLLKETKDLQEKKDYEKVFLPLKNILRSSFRSFVDMDLAIGFLERILAELGSDGNFPQAFYKKLSGYGPKIKRFRELERMITREQILPFGENQIALSVCGSLDRSAILGIELIGQDGRRFNLAAFGPPGTKFFAFPTNRRKRIVASVELVSVSFPAEVENLQKNLGKIIFPILHELGHLNDPITDEAKEAWKSFSLSGSREEKIAWLKAQAAREHEAWKRAREFAERLKTELSIDIFEVFEDKQIADRLVYGALSDYEARALKAVGDEVRGLFIKKGERIMPFSERKALFDQFIDFD